MDVLSDVLKLLRLKASVYFHSNFCGAWSISSPKSNIARFHIVERGTCWLHMPENEHPITLRSGDLIFFPRDARHIVTATCDAPSEALEPGIVLDPENEGPTTRIICGSFEFESNLVNPILNALPNVVHIKSDDPNNTTWLDPLMRFIYQETENESLGSVAVVDKLCDVLFVQIIKSWINKKETVSGFLAALSDPQLYQSLERFHTTPTAVWTVELLAEEAGMSRSAFSKRFQLIMQVTPMYYVTHWRMQCAHELLVTTNRSIAQIADDFTYQSEASFRKAFKQHIGTPPGAIRKSKDTNS